MKLSLKLNQNISHIMLMLPQLQASTELCLVDVSRF